MKKFLVLYISFLFVQVHAYIVEYVVFKKEHAPDVHLLFDVHTEEKTDTMYPMEKKHKQEFLKFISTHTQKNKVIVEDLEALSLQKDDVGVDHSLMLDWLSFECQKIGVHTVNVDCRALFSAARNYTDMRIYFEKEKVKKRLGAAKLKKIHNKLNQSKISLDKICAEFKQNVDTIKKFKCNKILCHYFAQQIAVLTKRFNKTLGLLKNTNQSLYHNVVAQCKTKKQRKWFLEKLDNIDNEFVDMNALVEIYKAQQEKKKTVFVILGAFHSHNVSKVLLQLGYKSIWRAAHLDVSKNDDYHHQKGINLFKALCTQSSGSCQIKIKHVKKTSCCEQLKSLFYRSE